MGTFFQSSSEEVSFTINTNRPFTLYEFNRRLREEIENALPHRYWIIAEISEARVHHQSGHCYLTLTDKEPGSKSTLTAQARGTVWKRQYQEIAQYFEAQTGHPLRAGLKILFNASPRFHELYGFSLDIHDIDPTYTLGDLARQRQETIARLETEGLLKLNQKQVLPEVPQRLAIISSPTAAGYQDFVAQLGNNPFGYHFQLTLFEASVQGMEAVSSIKAALSRVTLQRQAFDAVVIIRGGGSQTDLLCFDHYELASAVAQMSLPVLTGIGHERDESITDLVAHTPLKTPTAVAAFLIDRLAEFEAGMDDVFLQIKDAATALAVAAERRVALLAAQVQQGTNQFLHRRQFQLECQTRTLSDKPQKFLTEEQRHVMCEELRLTHSVEQLLRAKGTKQQNYLLHLETNTLKKLETGQRKVTHVEHCLQLSAKQRLQNAQMHFQKNQQRLLYGAKDQLQIKGHQLQLMEMDVKSHDPEIMLMRGYTLTYVNGKLLRSLDQVTSGDVLQTRLLAGSVISKVTKTKEPDLFD
ncbi:exodeoxyribonuclease VII large subunit [Rufibacter sediminis]|uniref:Exodeoxyribonuclease 7 large subunit n=1 Tax=Rufibacter sediminis TaxID=2762756 RepID=A0ABR6VWC7_9BACT|nr:exodeoxyribonuclease VII large subunit [Rufibacter sediminis]MBC3541451.1 exodeoxyribonuclease VII large subunit [Rufibacter sediminis]